VDTCSLVSTGDWAIFRANETCESPEVPYDFSPPAPPQQFSRFNLQIHIPVLTPSEHVSFQSTMLMKILDLGVSLWDQKVHRRAVLTRTPDFRQQELTGS